MPTDQHTESIFAKLKAMAKESFKDTVIITAVQQPSFTRFKASKPVDTVYFLDYIDSPRKRKP